MSVGEGPDFICVGMPKAGTGWLYDQLRHHPDFWMPPVKELLYLHRSSPVIPLEGSRGGYVLRQIIRSDDRPGTRLKGARQRDHLKQQHTADPRDVAFLEAAKICNGEPKSLASYASLFRFKDGLLSGDISPPYNELDEDSVAQVARCFPNAKVLLLVRDPVSRAWSRICMFHRAGKFDSRLLDDSDGFREFVNKSKRTQGKLLPTKIVMRWRQHAPLTEFRPFLFDDIVEEPETARRQILSFLGADPDKRGGLHANYNRKQRSAKLTLPDKIKAVLVDFFREEILASAQMFGGRATNWLQKYGLE